MLHRTLLFAALLLVGCERPFVEPEAPTVELLGDLDLSIVRTEERLPLAFEASSSFSNVTRIDVNGEATTFIREQDIYLDTLRLEQGLNRIVVEAFDGLGTVGGDTLFAVYLPFQFAALAFTRLPTPVGGHTATPLPDGAILLTGGAVSTAAPGRDVALRLDPTTFSVAPLDTPMVAARTGHAASRLPDGRVLLTGGSTVATPALASDFVTTLELFDPATDTFTEVPLVAADGGAVAPVARTQHTVTVLEGGDGSVSVYLYGGIANLGTAESPRLEPSPFMRRLVFEDGADGPRLVAPNRSDGFRFAATAGHTQTALSDVETDGFGRYLVAGTSEPTDPEPPLPYDLAFQSGSIDTRLVEPMQTPRTDHAAGLLSPLDDLVLITGGLDPTGPVALTTSEVFAGEAARFFRFADRTRLAVPRWRHTATNVGAARILVVGGFSASGEALDLIELFTELPSR